MQQNQPNKNNLMSEPYNQHQIELIELKFSCFSNSRIQVDWKRIQILYVGVRKNK